MRLLHTSDWHLGHELAGFDRRYEHACFLAFLANTLVTEAVDVLLVTGDLFDVQTPPASAQEMLYRFLVDVHRRAPKLRTILLGGNHDSPARLEAPHPFATPLGITVVGALPKQPAPLPHGVDFARCLLPIPTTEAPEAVLLAIPFLRTIDLPVPGAEAEFANVHATSFGVASIYRQAFAEAARRFPGLPVIASGHMYLLDVNEEDLSLDTERPILGGHQHAVPAAIFPEDVAYVALGHLHKPQRVAKRENVRYSGSPIPLSFTEKNYKHSFVLFDSARSGTDQIRLVPIPRTVEFLAVPAKKKAQLGLGTASAYGTKDLVLEELQKLPDVSKTPDEQRPFLTVTVVLDRPEPGLKEELRKVIAPKGYRVVSIAESAGNIRHDEVRIPENVSRKIPSPRELLRQVLEDKYKSVDPALMALFEEAEQAVHEGEEP
jgi:exonuclease SbcD